MKAKTTLKFNLDDPDDKMAHLVAVKAGDMALVLWQITCNLKKECSRKVEVDNLSGDEAIDMVFDKIYELLDEAGIIPDELVI